MGRNKALLTLDNRTFIEIAASVVAQAAGNVAIVGPPEIYLRFGFPVVPDLQPNLGPLAGIEAALSASAASWNLIVACDMPRLTLPLLRGILEEAQAHPDARCVLPVSDGGRAEPLCAAYHKGILPAISEALQAGTRKVTQALPRESIRYLPVNGRAFENVNTPEEWRRLGVSG
jgi:molybdopterin-guanine dinucleotide biosynthesis protein A